MAALPIILLTLAIREFIGWYLRPTSKTQIQSNKSSRAHWLDPLSEDEIDCFTPPAKICPLETLDIEKGENQSARRVRSENKGIQLSESDLHLPLTPSTGLVSEEEIFTSVPNHFIHYSSDQPPPRVESSNEDAPDVADTKDAQVLLSLAESIIPNAEFDLFPDCRLLTRAAVVNDLRTWIDNPLPPQNHLLYFKCSSDNKSPNTSGTDDTNAIQNASSEPTASLGITLVFSESPPSERDKSSLRFPVTAYSLRELSEKMAADFSDSSDSTFDEPEKNPDDEFERLFTERFGKSGKELVKEPGIYAIAFGWPS